jgi:hypothetical protein
MMNPLYRITLLTLLATVAGCSAPSRLEDLVEARQQSANLLVEFTRSADASNRAVMADTDERSRQYAHEARVGTEAVRRSVAALKTLLERAHFAGEREHLRTFEDQFGRYQDLDRQILELAVENTNLKAQRLSFGPAQQAADAFRDAVTTLTPRRPADAVRVRAAAAAAVAAIREIQVLHAPHIAEADDPAMSGFEVRMGDATVTTRAAIAELRVLVGKPDEAGIAAANTALDRFLSVHAEILELSRRNSNVRSLQLTLNQKRVLTSECEVSARALRDELEKRSLVGSR